MDERPLYSFPISVDRKEPIRDGTGRSAYSYVRRSGDKSLEINQILVCNGKDITLLVCVCRVLVSVV